MRVPKRLLYLSWRLAPGENESQVGGPFREWNNRLAGMQGENEVFDQGG